MSKNILFIGAGASFGARVHQTEKPPLGLDLVQWLRNKSSALLEKPKMVDLFSTITTAKGILEAHPSENNFEHLVSHLQRDKRLSVQRLLQICFCDLSRRELDLGFNNSADYYDDLIQKLNIQPDEWNIISLNYDRLFEEALVRNGLAVVYPHFPFSLGQSHLTQEGIRIYKPHGSINFFAQPDHRFSYGNTPPEPGAATRIKFRENGEVCPNYPTIFAGMDGTENVLTRARSGAITQPVMANYTVGKDTDVNELTLKQVRDEALSLCSGARIVVIGVRPILDHTDDPFVTAVLNSKFTEFSYVSKSSDPREIEKLKAIQRSGIFHDSGLLAYVNTLPKTTKSL